jgi:hypothetical protein
LNDNSEPGDDERCELRSSTVMPAARRRPSFEFLVDDLLIRLRCLSTSTPEVARTVPLYGLAEEPQLRALFREAKVWWLTNELAGLEAESRRWLIFEVYQRSPDEAAILALALFGAVAFPELCLEDVETMGSWFDSCPAPARSVRDALVLKVWLPWFMRQSDTTIEGKLCSWMASSPCRVRAALVLCVGLSHESSSFGSNSAVLGVLSGLSVHRHHEVGSAIGWFLSTAWHRDPDAVEHWLSANAGKLSRRVFRIAVGRTPTPTRVRLIGLWKASRQEFV